MTQVKPYFGLQLEDNLESIFRYLVLTQSDWLAILKFGDDNVHMLARSLSKLLLRRFCDCVHSKSLPTVTLIRIADNGYLPQLWSFLHL